MRQAARGALAIDQKFWSTWQQLTDSSLISGMFQGPGPTLGPLNYPGFPPSNGIPTRKESLPHHGHGSPHTALPETKNNCIQITVAKGSLSTCKACYSPSSRPTQCSAVSCAASLNIFICFRFSIMFYVFNSLCIKWLNTHTAEETAFIHYIL